jgi:hypothetical protein
MKRTAIFVIALGAVSVLASMLPQSILADASATPADRIVVMYFHRTQRCPTCLRMGTYAEEAVVKGFTREIKAGTVEFHYVDFQDDANAALTNGYKVTGPTLIVAKIVGNKVKEYVNLTEIWAKNGNKDEFLKYVRDNVAAYQKAIQESATKRDADSAVEKTK